MSMEPAGHKLVGGAASVCVSRLSPAPTAKEHTRQASHTLSQTAHSAATHIDRAGSQHAANQVLGALRQLHIFWQRISRIDDVATIIFILGIEGILPSQHDIQNDAAGPNVSFLQGTTRSAGCCDVTLKVC